MAGDSANPHEIVEKGVREKVRDVVKYEIGRYYLKVFEDLDQWLGDVVKACGRLPVEEAEKCAEERLVDIKKELKDRLRLVIKKIEEKLALQHILVAGSFAIRGKTTSI